MASYKVLYWQEVPSQIKAEDDTDDVTVLMPDRFQERIDRLAAERGLGGSDDYLAQWRWSALFVRDVDKSWQKLKMEGSRMQLAFVPEGRQRDA